MRGPPAPLPSLIHRHLTLLASVEDVFGHLASGTMCVVDGCFVTHIQHTYIQLAVGLLHRWQCLGSQSVSPGSTVRQFVLSCQNLLLPPGLPAELESLLAVMRPVADLAATVQCVWGDVG